MATAIEFNHVGKQYRLGLVSTGTISHDLNRWWQTAILRREDPYLKIGSVNDRTMKADSDYVWALRDIDFKVEQGDVVGIIGKNGAGKSTLLKLLSKVTGPTVGSIRARGRIASLLEVGTGFHSEMTGRENIFMNGAILGMTKQEIASKLDEIVDFSGCERYLDTPVKRYSSGMMVRLGFAVAAHLDPEILVVDEVLAVGDAEFQKKAIGKMQDISKGQGRTVLFVSHSMGAVRNLCKSGILLDKGQIIFSGTAADTIENYLSDRTDSYESQNRELSKYRLPDLPLDVVFTSIVVSSETSLTTKEDIEIIFKVFGNKAAKNFRLYLTIYNSEEVPIGGIFDETCYSVAEGEEKTIRLLLKSHNLTKGDYYVSYALGRGDFKQGISAIDIVDKYSKLTVTHYDSSLDYAIWNKGWGNIMFESKSGEI